MLTLPTDKELATAGFDSANYYETTLDLKTGAGQDSGGQDFVGDDLGGEATDGIFVFSTSFDEDGTRVNKLYAGLTPDVNLGETLATPDESAPTTAVWVGRAIVQTFTSPSRDNAELYRTGVVGLTDVFELTVNFTNSTIYSDTTVGINQKTAKLVVDGGFSELGVIFGTTSLQLRGFKDSGPLTGLIGTKGALGVFHSGTTSVDRAFAGGFVASATICPDDPFADGCERDKAAELERISFCETSPTDGKCTEICNANSFLPECVAIAFDTVRTTACLLDAGADTAAIGETPSRCIDLIDIHCKNVNPFDTNGGCNSNMAYNDQREVLCASDITTNLVVTARCTDTVIRACGVNPFNADLCYVGDTHEGARVDLCNNPLGSSPDPTCISDNIVDVYCEKNRDSAGTNTRCDDWVVAECGANPFDPLCGDSGYDDERTTACLGGNIDTNTNVPDRCPNLIDIHCTASPFDVRTNPVGGALWCENYSAQRTQLVADCLANPQTTTGCDAKLGTGKDTVANCVLDPFLTGCLDGMNDPLSVLSSAVIAYCTKDANVFQMNCDREEAKTPRANLIMRCVPSEEETPVECGTIIVDGEISVSECIADPFLVECRITEFAEFAAGKCVTDADNSLGRLFSPLCPDSNLLELRRNSYCRASNNLFKMNCDGRGSVDATRVDAVATCIAFGLDDPGCGKDRKLSDADNALTLGGCIENPYHADCRDAVFDPARPLVVTKCFDSRNNPIAVAECDTVVANGRTVAQCITDPFHLDCADAGFNDAKIARDTLCKAKKDYFDPLCDAYTDITTTRANFVNDCIAIAKPARAMDADCAAFVNACLDNPYPTDEQGTPTLLCEYPAAFAGARLTHCGKDKNVETVSQCGDLDTANSGCITDPFDASCGSNYSELRQSRRDYCNALGSPTAAEAEANNFCTKAIVDVCANPFGPICGVAYDPERLRRCRNEIATAMACVDTIKLVCTGRTGDNPFTANPFDELCYRDDNVAEDALIYQADRVTFANKCNDDVTVPSSESAGVDCSIAKPFICTGAGEVANPFAKICEGTSDLADLKRIKCLEIDDFRGECAGIVAGSDVDSKVWQYRAVSVDDKGNDEASDDTYDPLIVLTEPSDNDPTANFLLSGATQTQLLAGKLHSVSPVETLNLATGGGDNLVVPDLGGLDTDGVFVFNGTVDSVNKLYAGLLPNVNLGAKLAMPADGVPTTAVWIGRVVLQTFAGVGAGVADIYRSRANDFALSIDYTTSRISATTEVSLDTDAATLATLAIDGGFNELGVIFGTTMLTVGANEDSGLLAGLIGMKSDGSVKSALGAFHSDTTPAARAYAGGFVASNKICTDNVFADGCDKDPTTHVMRETRCGISGDGDGVLTNGECAPTLARLCDADGDISAPFAPSAGASGYVCKDDPTFRPQREVVCAKEQMDNPTVALTAQCMPVVMISCMDNPLNHELCYYTGNPYTEARGLACIADITDNGAVRPECVYEGEDAITVFCATPDGMTNSATNGCDATAEATRTTCAADPFNEDCLTSVTSDTYAQLRLNKCIAAAFGMTDTVDSTCSTLVDTYCTNNPFANNVHCTDGTTYDTPRITRAHKCYNPANRDTEECNNIKGCLNPANLFSDSAQFGGIACNNTLLQGVRVRYCSEGDNIETNENCVTLANDTSSCTSNPFSNCAGVLDGALLTEVQTNRINYCFKGGNGSNGNTCFRATFAESCILNPFADSCTDKYADQRQQRVDYCTDDADPDNLPSRTVCRDVDNTLDAICNDTGDYADAFAYYCRTFGAISKYELKRKNVALLCLGDSPPTTCNRIADCLADPYTDSFLCNDEALTLAELKPKRIEACKSVTDPGVICAEQALVEVCNTTPLRGIATRQTSLIILKRG